MIRKRMAVFCSMAMLLCYSVAVTNVQAAIADPNYSGAAAAAYAEKWAKSYNIKQYYNELTNIKYLDERNMNYMDGLFMISNSAIFEVW